LASPSNRELSKQLESLQIGNLSALLIDGRRVRSPVIKVLQNGMYVSTSIEENALAA
jgi:hypothetical protein